MSSSDYKKMFAGATMRNEEGFVLITVMIVLLLLMGLVLAAANSSLVEILIAKNNQEYTERLYQAEGAAKEIIEKLNTQLDNFAIKPEDMDKTTEGAWIQNPPDANSGALSTLADIERLLDASGPSNPGDQPPSFFNPPATEAKALKNILGATADIKSLAIYRGPVGGDKASTLNMGSSSGSSGKVYQYEIIGQAKSKRASGGQASATIINIGYKKRLIQ
jgi:type II secretory pathway pseudopilin PulG